MRTAPGKSGNNASDQPSVSDDGNRIAFRSAASDLVSEPGTALTEIYVRDRIAGTTTRVGVASDGAPANGPSAEPRITGDGRYVAFATPAQLVPDDENYLDDVYVRDRLKSKTRRISTTLLQGEVYEPSEAPALSGDGRSVAFQSSAPDLVGGDGNHVDDVFIKPVTVPSVSAVAPSSITRGTSATVTVSGTGFLPGVTVLIPATGMSVGTVAVQSETKLTVQVTASPDAMAGTATLWIVLPGTGAGGTVSSVGLCPCLAVS